MQVISQREITSRKHWVAEIARISATAGQAFADRATDLEALIIAEIDAEVQEGGRSALLAHLRLCGAIPESYGHDSTEEKLYSKYTDIVIAQAFAAMGIRSLVLTERANSADVECVSETLDFVADAKAFRLSRTAKNQKDFKVDAMDGWKRGKPHATVVCPIYQLPARTSQIYAKAGQRSVCVLSYSHLAVLLQHAIRVGRDESQAVLLRVFAAVDDMTPSSSAVDYWRTVNRAMIGGGDGIREIWREEKVASGESVVLAREEALGFLAAERARIMRLSHDQAIREVIRTAKITSREAAIRNVGDNGLFEIV